MNRPDVLVFDMGLDKAEVAMVTVALAACDELDSTPVVMVDPDEPMNTSACATASTTPSASAAASTSAAACAHRADRVAPPGLSPPTAVSL